jgi:hypothetical protein
MGVCPPFPLRDEAGQVIDPVKGVNATAPYSPKQTCGAKGCHDYDKVTRGFHFTQGKGEAVPPAMAERYAWVSAPGNYGGNWCSPAPLYRQLAPKQNANARLIDMTSFEFVTATCGNCHPGGGPLEFDRAGKRYDAWMRDPASGLASGGENGFDGDYFKARWSETGVIEADCLLCHMPEYDLKRRNAELAGLNFRWAATAGAGFGQVSGQVKEGGQPVVAYDKGRFDANGNVFVHIAPEPTHVTRPTLIRYKGKIYPANRVHSAWVGFEETGRPGLNQLFMKDFFQMWTQHRADPAHKYPELTRITDDNRDGVIEVNRPAEIDALLAAARAHLAATGFPLENRRLVWVADSRAYYSGNESRELPREPYEATGYASVYKFSHDVAPAKAALGAGGCVDCHRPGAPFFQSAVLAAAFSGDDARPRWIPNHEILGIAPFWIWLGGVRETILKPIIYGLLGVLAIQLLTLGLIHLSGRRFVSVPTEVKLLSWIWLPGATVLVCLFLWSPDLLEYMTLRRFTLDAGHFWVGAIALLAGLTWLLAMSPDISGIRRRLRQVGVGFVTVLVVAGGFMLIRWEFLSLMNRLAYTAFDAAASGILLTVLLGLSGGSPGESGFCLQVQDAERHST